jgi:hypothetical protein
MFETTNQWINTQMQYLKKVDSQRPASKNGLSRCRAIIRLQRHVADSY